MHKLITHVNPYTNVSYADDPTIFAYETGNELEGPVSRDLDVPVAWVSEIGKLIKSLAPMKLLVDGTYGVSSAHLAIPEVDILSNHGYPISVSKLKSDLALGKMNTIGQNNEFPRCSQELTMKTIQWRRPTRRFCRASTPGTASLVVTMTR